MDLFALLSSKLPRLQPLYFGIVIVILFGVSVFCFNFVDDGPVLIEEDAVQGDAYLKEMTKGEFQKSEKFAF